MNLVRNIQQTAREVLLQEAEAIKHLAEYIDDSFQQLVIEILSLRGRVIVTGIGKSAIIANKIVATLNSTGTPSIFMHAADAIHGDLGMVQEGDLAICISKSGNTPEVKVLVPLLRRQGIKIAALVSNTESYLAKQSDFILNATIGEEACPNNLAPTTSTTAHLAMGDALAICLLEQRNFTSRDFARYHPGGALGKQLYLKVDDLITLNDCPRVSPEASVKDVIVEISTKRLGATSVTDTNGRLVGIITDGDVRRMLEKHSDLSSIKARDIMTVSPRRVETGTYAAKALKIMEDFNITQLVVTDGNDCVAGFVHLHDLLKEGIV
ncbi:SIS domain-containing protein [Roseivirga sp. BDSF3-8]|uniref:KpsF/GutQ family sugar-phosphate isomerase n=1 Tax=Roseivirga sp. BDSF3-8 TaxID=3241598 RepID=UPI003531D15B